MSRSEGVKSQFLRRGEHTSAVSLPIGPSVLIDEGKGTIVNIPTGDSQTPPPFSRQRPRFATAQDLDDALLQAIEGKINRKNAWASKDASNLLEGITHTVESTLEAANSTDEYSSFAKVATVVEGCSKVWTSRVDSTYQRSNQMVRRLLRNEDGEEREPNSEEEGEAGANGERDPAMAAAERRRKAAQRRAQPGRTLALDRSEINLDSRARTALVHTGVNAQFRAVTEKFDQGNAQGLLLNNTPLGSAGNFILDVDYSRGGGGEDGIAPSARSAAPIKTETDESTAEPRATESVDAFVNVPLDLPPFPQPIAADGSAQSSRRTSGRESGNAGWRGLQDALKTEESEAGRPSITLPSLLILPHPGEAEAGQSEAPLEDAMPPEYGPQTLYSSGAEAPLPLPLPVSSSTRTSTFANTAGQQTGEDNADDMGGDWGDGGGMDTFDEDDGGGVGTSDIPRDRLAAEARHLVSGASELNAMDGCLFGENRLALEADDPTAWFPLAEPPRNPLGGVAPNSELHRLHREHRLGHSAAPIAGDGAATAGRGANGVSATKRGRREKTVVFDLPGELAATAGEASGNVSSSSFSSLLFNTNAVDSSALKQGMTMWKNMTPLGKELLFGKDPNTVVAYTQSATQRIKAQENHLLLPEPPVPGKSVPFYMPYPITVPSFFQPFSTSLLQWNLLRKSATGHTMALSTAPSRRVSAGGKAHNSWGPTAAASNPMDPANPHAFAPNEPNHPANPDEDDNGAVAGVGDMPVEFFHGGAEEDDAFMGAGGFDDDYDARSNAEDEVQLAQRQILDSFERAELARVSGGTGNARLSSVGVTGSEGADAVQMLRVLQPTQAALPSQVDVVRLRHAMWDALCGVMAPTQSTPSGADRKSRKRRRPEEEEEEVVNALPRFSEVVKSVLPQVSNGISTSGTLSPAFFFFSILFLANERGVVLESVPGLDDLIVRGLSQNTSASERDDMH